MPKAASDIVTLVKRSQTHERAIHEIAAIIGKQDPDSATQALVEASGRLPAEAIGYVVAPSLLTLLVHNAALFQALATQVRKRQATPEVRAILLDCLHKAARKHGRDWTRTVCAVLREIALDKKTAARLRAKATRLLSIDNDSAVVDILRLHFSAGNTDVCDAAAHLLHYWHVTKDRRRIGLDSQLIRWAKRLPKEALRSNGVLRALTHTTKGRQALRTIERHARTPQQRLRLLGAAGPGLGPSILATFIREQTKKGSMLAECLLVSLFKRYPEQLRLLYTKGFFAEYLHMVRRAPFLESHDALRRIRTAISNNGEHSSTAMLRAQLAYSVRRRLPLFVPDQGRPLASGYETGFQVGDALYRNLITSMGNAEHWHGGIFVGFYVSPSGESCEMAGIQAGGGEIPGWSDTIEFFQASRSAPSARTDLADWMQQFRSDFLRQFADGRANHPFHGPRSTPGITRYQRHQIVLSATSMYGMNIWWTWVDMLDYKWGGWAGTVDDIDEVRCDGVIEFSYEEQSLRVCGGSHPNQRNQWNIALPGKNHPENHNDFHNHAYNTGELCPRIQAGDQGSDSRFIIPPPVRPIITEFGATPWVYFFAPMIFFDTNVSNSYDVFVRLLVRRGNSASFYIVETEDPYGGMGTPVGVWRLMKTHANQAIAAFWLGKTLGGRSFRGRNDVYEFRIQVIDGGGNVSDELATRVDIVWP